MEKIRALEYRISELEAEIKTLKAREHEVTRRELELEIRERKQLELRSILGDTAESARGEWRVFLQRPVLIFIGKTRVRVSVEEQLRITRKLVQRLPFLVQAKKNLQD